MTATVGMRQYTGSRRDCGLRVGSATVRRRSGGKIFPGFRMPCGSKACFTRFISAIASGDSSSDRNGAFV